jgi:prepilin-type processing-associated H-X9-DG protein
MFPLANSRERPGSDIIDHYWWRSIDTIGGVRSVNPTGGLLQPYLKNAVIQNCPSSGSMVDSSIADAKGVSSYACNTYVQNTNFRNATSWERPADSFLVGEGGVLSVGKLYANEFVYPPASSTAFYPPTVMGWHDDRTNVVWIDGHASGKPIAYVTVAQQPTMAAVYKTTRIGYLPGPGGLATESVNPLVNFYFLPVKPAGS